MDVNPSDLRPAAIDIVTMRRLILLLATLCISCAGQLPRDARISRMIGAHLAPRQICVRLPDDGEWTIVREDEISIRGFPGRNGGFVYPDRMERRDESMREAYDLLAELGFYTVEEEVLPDPWPGRMRRYKPTALAQAHIRLVQGGHGQSGWYGLCYGQRRLVAIEKVKPVDYAPCRISREIYYIYDYVGIPDWADDPRLRRLFPDMIGTAEARTARNGGDFLVRSGDEWFVEQRSAEPYFIPCGRREDGSFKTD
jgi:hypothetical protein